MCTNNDVQFDFSADFADSNYKSCFARSVVVNSQYHGRSLDLRQLQMGPKEETIVENKPPPPPPPPVASEVSRLKKVLIYALIARLNVKF